MKYIYLASPYSHEDPAVMQQRYEAVCKKAAKMMQEGWPVFCPIAQNHPIAAHLPEEYLLDSGFWMDMDLPLLRYADELHVLMLPGAMLSKGVNREIQFAIQLDIPIRYVHEEENL